MTTKSNRGVISGCVYITVVVTYTEGGNITITQLHNKSTDILKSVVYPGIFSGGGSTNSVEDRGQRERGSGGGNPLVRGSGGSCSLVQEISFHIVKFSQFLVL